MKKDYGDIRVYQQKNGFWGLLVRNPHQREYYTPCPWSDLYPTREAAVEGGKKWKALFKKTQSNDRAAIMSMRKRGIYK